ncbi:hypothetical protein [Limibacterium fermenti]|jgi:hypothetical protein|uniref:hypothetical protein n=1 Tax=Limibacterium fermenti TaxID=3229863 RepID=UPI002696A060
MLEQLDYQEMSEIKGGISAEEYCAILDQLMEDNWGGWSDGKKHSASSAYAKHC